MTKEEAIKKFGEPDERGHVTRFSDSSLYDEVCVLCGARDYLSGFGDSGARFFAQCPGESA